MESLLVMLPDLESCAGNDTLVSESDIRRTAHTLPVLLAGADFIFSGYGSIPRYDNTFAISNFNADDLDDYLVLQRDWGVDGGLRSVPAERLEAVRRRAAQAVQAVYRDLGLASYDDDRVEAAVFANDSRDLPAGDPLAVPEAARAIEARQLTVVDVVGALARTGFAEEAEAVMALTRARLVGDQLQTSAIFDEQLNVLSKITDPNDYRGPGTGYSPSTARRREIDTIRQARTPAELTADQAEHVGHVTFRDLGPAAAGTDPREVVLGVSPALGRSVWRTLSGLGRVSQSRAGPGAASAPDPARRRSESAAGCAERLRRRRSGCGASPGPGGIERHVLGVGEVVRQISAGLEEEGCLLRLVRVTASIDVGQIGLTAARLAGSGIGMGLQGKGTALIHRRDRTALANLELFSVAPLLVARNYRDLGRNAARHAKQMAPAPILLHGTDEAITARYHARAVALVHLERELCIPGSAPVDVEIVR